MRDHADRFERKGAEVVAIGMGFPAMAADFKSKQDIPFRLLVDKDQQTYQALELERSLTGAAGPRVWLRGAKSMVMGHGLAKPKQDWQQLGGAMVIDKEGEVLLVHRAKDSSDNLPVEELLEVLP